MKKNICLLLMIISATAFGQNSPDNTSTSKMSTYTSPIGVYVGLDYMNLTDVHFKYSSRSEYFGNYSDSSAGGTHMGMAGITVGYNRTPERGIGFSAGARLLQSFNKSEYGEDKINMIIPEGNFTWASNRFLTGYVGLNLSVWTGSKQIEKYDTQLGGQLGIGVRITKNLSINSGYTIMNQTRKDKYDSETSTLDVQLSGFNSNFTVIF